MEELELSSQAVELLPTREALGGHFSGVGDIVIVNQFNVIVALNFGDTDQDIEASNVADIEL
jgi:hypothetical protein